MSTRVFTFEQAVSASPDQVIYAFTNASALREWLCEIATVDPRPGGRMYLAWNSGYYAAGEYATVDLERQVSFVWCGRDDPARSQVTVTAEPHEQGSKVTLEHTLPDEGQDWTRTLKEIEQGWRDSLENLASVLSSGEDMRFTRRPMLGITVNDFNPQQAEELGVPVSSGIRIDDVVDGMGAQIAGLRKNDVLIRMAGQDIIAYSDLSVALAGKRAGDVVPVVIYRGAEQIELPMALSQRPLPELPDSLSDLTTQVRSAQARLKTEIEQFFASVGDEEAGMRPLPNQWSVKETIAHLIQGERGYQTYITEVVGGEERWSDNFAGNLDAAVQATVEAYPHLPELLEALYRAYAETVALYAHLPASLLDRKGAYWRLAYNAMQLNYHFYAHLDQMKAALEQVRAQH